MERSLEQAAPTSAGTSRNQGRSIAGGQTSGILNGLPRGKGKTMPEHRARKHHQDRVAETLREEIGAMIEGELIDPRIAFCYVSEVILNPGGKSARVYVAVDSSVPEIEKAEQETLAGLEAAKGFIRFELKERMGVRHVPELAFLADRSGRFQERIRELMNRAKKSAARQRQNAAVE
jgi:ribosome-binding factor A